MAQKVATQNDASAESPFFHKPKFCDIPSLRKHPPTVIQHERIDEQSNFIDEIRTEEIVAERDAPGEHNVEAILGGEFLYLLGEAVAAAKNRCPIPAQPGSSSVLDTTYLATRLRWSVTPDLVIDLLGPEPTHLLNCRPPNQKAVRCCGVLSSSGCQLASLPCVSRRIEPRARVVDDPVKRDVLSHNDVSH